MKVLVLGAGVIGVTSAYYLAKTGHEVTVVDRQGEPALETSFANAGEVSPGYASPWAGPGVPIKAIKWLLMKHGPLVIRPDARSVDVGVAHQDAAQLHVGALCDQQEPDDPARRVQPRRLAALRADTGIRYDERSLGTLQLFRTQAQLDGAADDIAVLKQYGVPYELLDREGCIAAEPALAAVREKFVGGLRLPQDETGDCHMFTQALAAQRRKTRRAVPAWRDDRADHREWRAHRRRRHQRGCVACRRLCGRARQLVTAPAEGSSASPFPSIR